MRDLEPRRVLVTGGAGFIGSAFCRRFVSSSQSRVVVADKLTYAGNLLSLASISSHPRYRFERMDIAEADAIAVILREEAIDAVVHLAAETHVDRSIAAPAEFIETNIVGTFRLLQAVLAYWRELGQTARDAFRFHYVSTDEVFGEAGRDEKQVSGNYFPSSPYSASKAAGEHLVRAWHRTYGLPIIVSHASNNYGPYQYPDKLIPLTITNALQGRSIPVYGDGRNERSWLHVDDHARGLQLALARGRNGGTYHFGAAMAQANIVVVRAICAVLDRMNPRGNGRSYEDLITFVPDRPGHDLRYRLDPRRSEEELGWSPAVPFAEGLEETIFWFLENKSWWLPLRADTRTCPIC
ncbi:dTDP-glucose 4,6-dehydratase [Sphingomonas sp. SM33]|uniref:dTDP-glucose 4,6-dehydratase n=1 Tax=Sphingomonas telluris TaxID=2907998 RepID=A0ABS9VIQ8_9SPHN|nr:dTDP-glucose 4,6-dehydratase [Sphingomonas telluris]MCH8614860.1 dTDP-glucose 4,6-dehydratase [Sphingomonas telluris]